MTTPPTPQPQPAPLPERVQEMLAATEGHTAGLTMRVENDETDGDDLGYGSIQFPWRIHVSTGQALIIEVGALGDDMTHADAALIAAAPDLRALLAETAAALAAAEAREAGLRAALGRVQTLADTWSREADAIFGALPSDPGAGIRQAGRASELEARADALTAALGGTQ